MKKKTNKQNILKNHIIIKNKKKSLLKITTNFIQITKRVTNILYIKKNMPLKPYIYFF